MVDLTEPDALDDRDPAAVVDMATIKGWYRADSSHSGDWRKETRRNYDFAAGHQWDEDDADVLRDQDRPVITFNRVDPVIDSVAGTEVNNRQEVRFIPRQLGASGVNEVLTGAVKWDRDQCDAEDEESDAFRDLIISGMGWTRTGMEYEKDPEGKTEIERIDPLEMYWDATAKKKNLSDARRIMRVKEMDSADAEAMWPDFDLGEIDATWAGNTKDEGIHEQPLPMDAYKNGVSDKGPRKTVRVVEVEWWEKEPYYRVMDPQSGQVQNMSEADFAIASKKMLELTGQELQYAKQVRRVYYRAFVGTVVLESGPAPCPFGFSYKCMTGKRDRNSGTFYGLVRPMVDPQLWANKFFSQILYIINSNAKGGLMAETGAFVNSREAQEDWANPNSITMLKDGGLGKIQQKQAVQYPAGLGEMMQFAIGSIRDVTGVNLEMLGAADREQAGVLEATRQKTAITILAPLFDALRRYRKDQGEVHAYFIQTYMSDGRLVRITGPEGAQYVPLVKQPDTLIYDVVVDDAPTAPNQKEQAWATIQHMLPMVVDQLDAEDWAIILPYSPLPASVSQKLVERLKQKAAAAQQPNPQAEEMAQLQKDAVHAEVEKDKSTAWLNISKAGAENANALSQIANFASGYGPPPTAPMGPSPQAIQTAGQGIHDIALASHHAPDATNNIMTQMNHPQIVQN